MKLLEYMFHQVDFRQEGDHYHFRLRLLPECPVFRAHFPGAPITPGVCLMQVVEELMAEKLGRQITLVNVKNVKFLQVIEPEEGREIDYQIVWGEEMKATVEVTDSQATYAKMTLIFQ